MTDEERLIEIHKIANGISTAEYRGHEISMYDVGCVVRAIGELTKKMYEQEEQPEEAKS